MFVLKLIKIPMKKFLLIYHSPREAIERLKTMSEEEGAQIVATWGAWLEKHKDAIVDAGEPVGMQHVVSLNSSREESDDVTGYAIIQAENLEGAKRVLENHPSLIDDDGSTVSLYQIHEMQM